MRLETEIKKLGLSDKEAKVYLALLKLGQAPAAEIAVHSGIVRVTAYVILEDLRKKGLISTLAKNKKTIFAAEPPERLFGFFKIEENRIRESFYSLKRILPDLNKLYESQGEHPKTRFFEGSEGINSLREDILKTKTKFLYQILPIDAIQYSLAEKKFQDEKIKKLYSIPSKTIYCNKKGEIFPKKSDKAEYKFLADQFETEMIIYGNKIAFINVNKKQIGIIIDDTAVSQTLKIFFETLWKLLK